MGKSEEVFACNQSMPFIVEDPWIYHALHIKKYSFGKFDSYISFRLFVNVLYPSTYLEHNSFFHKAEGLILVL